MFQVYVLQSIRTGRLYIGSTADIINRFRAHNRGDVRSTRRYRPYRLVLQEEYATITEARKRENQIKKSGRLRKIIKQVAASSSNG